MKTKNSIVAMFLAVALICSGCGASNTFKGTAIGTGAGAATGAGIGAVIGGGKGAAWGAGIGAVVGGAAGAIIGNKMDKQKKELEAIENAKVESVNDGEALKVTFESGILFATGSYVLNPASQWSLTMFANSLKANPDTEINIIGHTDSTGTDQLNNQLSEDRAASVKSFLMSQGIMGVRMSTAGMGRYQPIATNDTAEGRTQNRRVEIFINPNQKMIQEAYQGR
ncbi:MAG: OmpA family protein [Prevotellaceae bacterium]|jgi:outer membrane protein OmpA-like peptidoglycan-associated protein|nr:OmpA family protein [Prevotellaceae bacterium]